MTRRDNAWSDPRDEDSDGADYDSATVTEDEPRDTIETPEPVDSELGFPVEMTDAIGTPAQRCSVCHVPISVDGDYEAGDLLYCEPCHDEAYPL